MEAKVWICDELRRGPFSGLDTVVGLDMAVDFRKELAKCGVYSGGLVSLRIYLREL
jgi:hypothetical protein